MYSLRDINLANVKQIKQELRAEKKDIEKIGPAEMAFILDQCNQIPRQCMKMYLNAVDPSIAPSKLNLKEKLKESIANDPAFTELIRVWEKSIQDLAKLAFHIQQKIKDKAIGHYQMLGIVSAFAYIYNTYTPGSIIEQVLGIIIGNYSKECNFSVAQTAKAVDVVTKQYKDLDLPLDITVEKYKKDREGYFKTLISFYTGVLSVYNVRIAAEIFSYLFSAPEKEITDQNEFQFQKGMESFFIKKLFDSLGYATAQCSDFVEIWDKDNHIRSFLHKIGKLHSYGFTYDGQTHKIIKSINAINAMNGNPNNSFLAKLLT